MAERAPVSVRLGLVCLHRRRDPLDRVLEPATADRLSQEVERAELERVDRGPVVSAHEHELGRRGEPSEDPAELDAVEVRHADVEEDRVVGLARDLEQGVVPAVRALDLVHRREAPEQPGEILQLGVLVVDGEDRQAI